MLEHFWILRNKTKKEKKKIQGQHRRGSWKRLQEGCVRDALAVDVQKENKGEMQTHVAS